MRKAGRYFPFLVTAVFALVLTAILLISDRVSQDLTLSFALETESTIDWDSRKININTANADELCILPGIGDALAAQIIAYREKYGDFSSIYELTQVAGIGDESFLKLRNYITVGG